MLEVDAPVLIVQVLAPLLPVVVQPLMPCSTSSLNTGSDVVPGSQVPGVDSVRKWNTADATAVPQVLLAVTRQ